MTTCLQNNWALSFMSCFSLKYYIVENWSLEELVFYFMRKLFLLLSCNFLNHYRFWKKADSHSRFQYLQDYHSRFQYLWTSQSIVCSVENVATSTYLTFDFPSRPCVLQNPLWLHEWQGNNFSQIFLCFLFLVLAYCLYHFASLFVVF